MSTTEKTIIGIALAVAAWMLYRARASVAAASDPSAEEPPIFHGTDQVIGTHNAPTKAPQSAITPGTNGSLTSSGLNF